MVPRLIQGVKLSEKNRTLTKSNTLNPIHPHLKDAALFSSVSKAKAADTALQPPPANTPNLCCLAVFNCRTRRRLTRWLLPGQPNSTYECVGFFLKSQKTFS